MFGCYPLYGDWIETQHAKPATPEIPDANVRARGPSGSSAMDAARRFHEAKLGKPLVWQLGEDQVWRLVEGPPPHEKVRKTK